jgi:glycosyltransferase involved in cell wall biosynthesis
VNDDAGPSRAPPHLTLDLSRLIYAAWSRTPTGIPRVELAYAEHFIATSPDRLTFAVLDAFGRLRVVDNRTAIAFVAGIARYWRGSVASNWAYARVVGRALYIHTALLFGIGGGLANLIARRGGRSVYIIPSQLHLERARIIERVKAAGNVSLVYFVHDIIPSVFPEYFPPDAEARNRRRMQTAARLADVVVTNSQDTADTFCSMFGRDRRPGSIVVAPLGLSIASPREAPAVGSGKPYFVMIGTIEPRKNHLLILNLWRALRAECGADTPRLIVIGGRGWENENIVDMLERSPALRGFVEERSRVSDEEMARLLVGARALLTPSFAEGYGLPLAETLALGVPALCSDIPAHREVGGDVPEFIDPLDGPAWRATILDYARQDSARRHAQLERLAGWRPTSWESHFRHLSEALEALETETPA